MSSSSSERASLVESLQRLVCDEGDKTHKLPFSQTQYFPSSHPSKLITP